MVGVCVTVVGIVRLLEVHGTMAALTSYGSIRSHKHQERLERYADLVFLGGLVIMVVASFMLAWEIGQHPIAKP
jgi:hypothetical protein